MIHCTGDAMPPRSTTIFVRTPTPWPAAWPVALLALTVVLCSSRGAARAEKIEFQASLADVQPTDGKPRPVVLTFGSRSCGWCRKMAAVTFPDPKVEALADRFAWVRIDIDEQSDVAARYRVRGVPHTFVVDASGRTIASQPGFIAPVPFVEFLTAALENPQPVEDSFADLLASLTAAEDEAARIEAVDKALEQLARADREGRDAVLSALRQAGPSLRPLLLERMGDARLSIRAAAAGALAHAMSADLPFDPFAPALQREEQREAWDQRLQLKAGGESP